MLCVGISVMYMFYVWNRAYIYNVLVSPCVGGSVVLPHTLYCMKYLLACAFICMYVSVKLRALISMQTAEPP